MVNWSFQDTKTIQWRKAFNKCWKYSISTWKRMKLETYFISYTKVNSKYLYLRVQIVQIIKENIEINFHDYGSWHQKNKQQKKKNRQIKLYQIKIKFYCASKDTNNRVKRKSTIWEKIYANLKSDMSLGSRIHKELKTWQLKDKQWNF